MNRLVLGVIFGAGSQLATACGAPVDGEQDDTGASHDGLSTESVGAGGGVARVCLNFDPGLSEVSDFLELDYMAR